MKTTPEPRTERVMIRLTEGEAAWLHTRATLLSKRRSGLAKADGSVNLSAAARAILLEGRR